MSIISSIHKYLLFISLFAVSAFCSAQNVLTGQVLGHDEKGQVAPLPGANVVWLGTTKGTSTDIDGKFKLNQVQNINRVVISFVGYNPDTVVITGYGQNFSHTLVQAVSIEAVTVTGTSVGSHFDRLNPIQTQNVSSNELRKAACCNLAESFETNASVDVSYADAVTGAKQIQMLGLAGIYSQMQFENIPSLRGLASVFGLNYVPGSWMESIQISKGTSSVTNGYESITGQINVEFKKPWEDEKYHFNIYGNSIGMAEVNANYAFNVKPNLYTMLLVNGSLLGHKSDHNDDGFIDHPLSTVYNVYNRWKYMGKSLESDFGVKYMNENRLGGQMDYKKDMLQVAGNPWGFDIETQRFEVYNKTGYIFDREATSIGFINSFTIHNQESSYGPRTYDANQQTYYSNLVFYTYIGNTNHSVSGGASFVYDSYDESLSTVNLDRFERVPGVYAEYTYKYMEKLTLMAGFRLDHHSKYGYFATPRAHAMYKPFEHLTLRASAGKGYRTPNAVAENTNLLASNRSFVFSEEAEMEEAWNFGASIIQRYKIGGRNITISTDYYRTNFVNQYIVDTDRDATSVYFYNLNGDSYSNSFQVEVNTQPLKGLDVVLAYRINDVKTTINNELQEKPLVSRNKGLASISYKTPLKKWQFDYTIHLNGSGRLPDMASYPVEVRRGEEFDSFVTMNFQLTKLFRRFDIYIGVENLTGFTQDNPIIYANNPYNQYFDASQIWGPITGAKYYAGLRITAWK